MKFVFIGGCGRSGTTLVQKILLTHSRIAGGGEFDFLPGLLKIYKEMCTPMRLERQQFFYTQQALSGYWGKFVDTLLANNIDKNKYDYFSEKTPSNISVAMQELELFPESKFVYVYRDGRDVINSFMEVKKRAKKTDQPIHITLKQWAFKWNEASFQYMQLKADTRFKGRYIAIRYEDLVSQPEKSVIALMDFLGLFYESAQIETETKKAGSVNMKVDNIWYSDKIFEQKINNDNVGKWKKGLNLIQKVKYQVMMAPYLTEFQYTINPVYIKINDIFKKLYHSLSK